MTVVLASVIGMSNSAKVKLAEIFRLNAEWSLFRGI
ncbi:hypothetical protein F4694_006522 [Bacillus niacini]|uniref:Uncharacterized protein n=1 Tax=Neobacillus niacini TaxID=86668 RepID=A0A852TMK0_9BACI|nr:hypothetical protein [Neobacillus niacini]